MLEVTTVVLPLLPPMASNKICGTENINKFVDANVKQN